jgi:hypothetical protein
MTITASQFANFDLDAFLAGERTGMEDLGAALKREGLDAGWVMDELLRRGRVRPVELSRGDARFHVSKTVPGLLAHLRLPFLGDARLLGLGASPQPLPDGVGIAGDGGGTLWLRRTFPLDTTSDVIRQWATEQVDQLEQTLRATNDKVRAHNDSLRGIAEAISAPLEPHAEDVERLNRELSTQGA